MTIFPGGATPHSRRRRRARGGFSLIELVIVVVIMATVSAIAIPRIKSSSNRAQIAAVRANLEMLNKALEFYRIEHGGYPDPDQVNKQLTMFTDKSGTRFSDEPTGDGIDLGPYILKAPPVTMGPNEGNSAISGAPGPKVGWLYSERFWIIVPNFLDESNEIPADIIGLLGEVDAGVRVKEGDTGATGP